VSCRCSRASTVPSPALLPRAVAISDTGRAFIGKQNYVPGRKLSEPMRLFVRGYDIRPFTCPSRLLPCATSDQQAARPPKLADKIEALELLGKHHKLYVERHLHELGPGLADRLAAALARVDGQERSDDGEGRSVRGNPQKSEIHQQNQCIWRRRRDSNSR
jgi:hypothetical protein